jgi:cell division protein FtsB
MKLPRRRRSTGISAPPSSAGRRGAERPRSGPSSGRPGGSRPAAQRRTAGSGRGRAAGRPLRPARRVPGGLTGRAAALGLVVCALVLSLGYPLKQYLAQRGEIGRLEQQRRATQERVKVLEQRKQRLSDPDYVKAQARQRLHFVLPGESVYVVVTPRQTSRPEVDVPPMRTVGRDGSWYDRLWDTARAADGAPGTAGPGVP